MLGEPGKGDNADHIERKYCMGTLENGNEDITLIFIKVLHSLIVPGILKRLKKLKERQEKRV